MILSIHLVMLATSWTYRYYFIVDIFNMQKRVDDII